MLIRKLLLVLQGVTGCTQHQAESEDVPSHGDCACRRALPAAHGSCRPNWFALPRMFQLTALVHHTFSRLYPAMPEAQGHVKQCPSAGDRDESGSYRIVSGLHTSLGGSLCSRSLRLMSMRGGNATSKAKCLRHQVSFQVGGHGKGRAVISEECADERRPALGKRIPPSHWNTTDRREERGGQGWGTS